MWEDKLYECWIWLKDCSSIGRLLAIQIHLFVYTYIRTVYIGVDENASLCFKGIMKQFSQNTTLQKEIKQTPWLIFNSENRLVCPVVSWFEKYIQWGEGKYSLLVNSTLIHNEYETAFRLSTAPKLPSVPTSHFLLFMSLIFSVFFSYFHWRLHKYFISQLFSASFSLRGFILLIAFKLAVVPSAILSFFHPEGRSW